MGKMNANIDGKTKNPIFIFAEYPCEMEDFLRVNPGLSRRIPNVLQFNDYIYADGTRRNHQQTSAYL